MHVSEAKAFRIQRMPEHLVVIMEGSKKSKKKSLTSSRFSTLSGLDTQTVYGRAVYANR